MFSWSLGYNHLQRYFCVPLLFHWAHYPFTLAKLFLNFLLTSESGYYVTAIIVLNSILRLYYSVIVCFSCLSMLSTVITYINTPSPSGYECFACSPPNRYLFVILILPVTISQTTHPTVSWCALLTPDLLPPGDHLNLRYKMKLLFIHQ